MLVVISFLKLTSFLLVILRIPEMNHKWNGIKNFGCLEDNLDNITRKLF